MPENIDTDMLDFMSDNNDYEILLAATQVEWALQETVSSMATTMWKSVPET